jgi:hypothetical protein
MFAQSFELITMSLSTDPLLGADDASGLSWQLVTTICDEADGLTLCVATNIFEKRDGKWLLCCHHASHTKR